MQGGESHVWGPSIHVAPSNPTDTLLCLSCQAGSPRRPRHGHTALSTLSASRAARDQRIAFTLSAASGPEPAPR